MISFVHKGDFSKTKGFFKRAKQLKYQIILEKYGKIGVDALRDATPVRTGTTANSWYYKIQNRSDGIAIEWFNSNRNNGVPIAIILQYGHATGTGGYVRGIDYINPALKPVFDDILENVWKEVTAE